MKLEDQVVSLNLALRLKELNLKQDSLFYWWKCSKKNKLSIVYTKGKIIDDDHCSAFTVAELGEMLPRELYYEDDILQLNFFYSRDLFAVNYFRIGEIDSDFMINILDEKEADARAKMLIYLIENDLWKPEND